MFPRPSTPPSGPRGSSPARRGMNRGGIHKRRGGLPRVDKDGDLVMDINERRAAVGSTSSRSEGNHSSRVRGPGRGGQLAGTPRGNLSTRQGQQAIIRGLESQQANIVQSRVNQSASSEHEGHRGKDPRRDFHNPFTSLRVRGLKESKAASNPDGGLMDLLSFLERKANSQDVEAHRAVKIKKFYMEGDNVIIIASPEDLVRIIKLNTFKFAGSTLLIEPHRYLSNDTSTKNEENLSQEALKTQEHIKSILSTRYDMALKLLNLSNLGQDPGLVQMGMFDAKNRISKLFPVLMAVCDRLFSSAQEKRDAIVSVTLAENDLDGIANIAALAQTFPDLQNLDLSRNKIADIQALAGWKWKFRKLQNLRLMENPIEHTSPGYAEEIARWFPSLQMLNEIQIRTPVEAAAAASSSKKGVEQSRKSDEAPPIPINGPDFRDVSQVGERFLREFLALYDKDRATLANNFYDQNSTHSLSINVSAPRSEEGASSHPFPSVAFNNSRNLVKVKALHGQMSKIFRGVQAIKSFWAELPPTLHPDLSTQTAKYLVDCHPLPGILDPLDQSSRGVDGLVLMLHGEFEEVDVSKVQRILRSFSRTFVLGPGLPVGPALRVISDILVLRAWSPLASTSSTQTESTVPAMLSAGLTKEILLEQIIFRTQMTPEYARLCLEETGWDLEKAIVAFDVNKSKLPVQAFMIPNATVTPSS